MHPHNTEETGVSTAKARAQPYPTGDEEIKMGKPKRGDKQQPKKQKGKPAKKNIRHPRKSPGQK